MGNDLVSNDPVVQAIPEVEAIAAFRSLQTNLERIAPEELIPLRYSANEATARGLWLAEHAQRDREYYVRVYKEPPQEAIQSMRARALAIKGAELATNPAPTAPVNLPDTHWAYSVRERHLHLLRAAFYQDEAIISKLDAIASGKGFMDLGSDLMELAVLEREKWATLATTNLVRQDELEKMGQVGTELIKWAGRKQDSRRSTTREMEQRAWTYMARAYHLLRDYAYLFYRDKPEIWEHDYPSLYTYTAPSHTKRQTVQTNVNAAPTPANSPTS